MLPHCHGPVPRSKLGKPDDASGLVASISRVFIFSVRGALLPSGGGCLLFQPSILWAASFHIDAIIKPLFAVHAGGICK